MSRGVSVRAWSQAGLLGRVLPTLPASARYVDVCWAEPHRDPWAQWPLSQPLQMITHKDPLHDFPSSSEEETKAQTGETTCPAQQPVRRGIRIQTRQCGSRLHGLYHCPPPFGKLHF